MSEKVKNPNATETDVEIFTRLVAEKKAENDTHDFEGQNCNDYLEDDQEACTGWDGEDRRCNCGNRRVSWILSDCKTYVYAEAY